MRCRACDKLLSDRETGRKDYHGVHLDLCNGCFMVSNGAETEAGTLNTLADTRGKSWVSTEES